jgi:hypothetical protein
MYLITIAPAVFGQFFVQSFLVVPSDATQTAQNIIEHERLFRIGIASDLVSFTGVVALIVALYVLKSRQIFIGLHNQTLSVIAMCVQSRSSVHCEPRLRHSRKSPTGFPQTVANARFCPSIVRFRRRIEVKCFCTWDIGRLLLMERAE